RMKIAELFDGITNKESILDDICAKFKITSDEVAYIGDDVNDIELLKKVGLSASPNDGVKEVKTICHYVCKSNGGQGAFREFADLILQIQCKH
ncbi:MAG: HAD hydrolase family protein, partial [Nitrosotalea sp.]